MRAAKQPRAIKTRDRILREAARLFALKGFHDTKVDQIIKAAEVTSGAFFHHFQGRPGVRCDRPPHGGASPDVGPDRRTSARRLW